MMFRLSNLLFLVGFVSSAASLEAPHLRTDNIEVVDAIITNNENEELDNLDVKAKFGIEKSVSCSGGCSKKKGMERTCKGHMKKSYSVGFLTDVAQDMATELSNEFRSVLPTDPSALVPSDISNVPGFDADDDVDDFEDGYSKSMEYGGSVKADWKCTVTWTKKLGKFSKEVECGFESSDGSGISITTSVPQEE